MVLKLSTLDRRILLIAVPSTIGYVTTPFIGIVDTAIVGRFDNIAMVAGLALGALAIDVILTTANFLRSGTTGLTAQALGRGAHNECRDIFWRAIIIALCIGLIVAGLRDYIGAASILVLGAKDGVADAVSTYLDIRLLSIPFALINYVVLGFLFGLGRSMWALGIQLFINLTNIGLSIKWGLWDGLGIAGVAHGTLAAEMLGALSGLAIIYGILGYRLPVSRHHFLSLEAFKRLTKMNSDIMVRSFVLLAAFALFTRLGSAMGTNQLAANAVLMHFFLLSGYFLDGLATAAEQLCGYAKGKRDQALFLINQSRTLVWSILIAISIAVIFALSYSMLIGVLTTNIELISVANEFAIWALITPITGVMAFHYDGVYIGSSWTRDMRRMMIVSFIIFALAAFVFSFALGNHGLWLALNIFLVVRGILLRYRMPYNLLVTFSASK